MNSLKAFFNRVTQCAIDPASYRQLRSEGLGNGYWYLYRLLFLTSLVTVLWLAAGLVNALPHIRSIAHETETTLPTIYPKQLVVKVQSGALTTNVKEPFAVPMPAQWARQFTDEDMKSPVNLAVFATSASPEDYEKYNTLVLFTKNYMVGGREGGELRMMPYSKFEKNFTVTHEVFIKNLNKNIALAKGFIPTLKVLTVSGFVIAPFLFAGLALLWWMLILVLYTLILWFFSSIAKWKYGFGEIYRLSVFGATPVIILGMLFWLVGASIPWVLQIYFLVWMWMVLKKLR